MSRSPTLLLVEDDVPLRRSMRLALRDEGYRVLEAATGDDGLRQVVEEPDAVLLDLLLPDGDGVDVCRRIRGVTPVPIVVISALTSDRDIARALTAGADDYITKPFRVSEVASRLGVLLRPSPPPNRTGDVVVGALRFPAAGGARDSRGRSLPLTHTELRLLLELSSEPDRTRGGSDLLRRIWGHESGVTARALEARVASLRRKLTECLGTPALTATPRGYRLDG